MRFESFLYQFVQRRLLSTARARVHEEEQVGIALVLMMRYR